MGSSSSTLLQNFHDSLQKGEKVDGNVLSELFSKYDKNKNGILEGQEVDEFLNDLYEFVYAKVTPAQTKQVAYKHISYSAVPVQHQPGCRGHNYPPQHMIPSVCTVTTIPPDSREGVIAFKKNLMKDLDPNGDGKLEWLEFWNGIQKVLQDCIVKETAVQNAN